MRLVAVCAVLLVSGCRSAPTAADGSARETKPAAVRITQFYAEPKLALGEKGNLCYGVENAKAVRLEPPVDRVWPAVTRCIPVSPTQSTTYKLTAEGADGATVSQMVEIRVGPPRPHINEVSVNQMSVKPGEEVVLCFKASNATSVDIGPGIWKTTRNSDAGCVSHRPATTTTYHVTVTGGGGETDSEKVTVTVKP